MILQEPEVLIRDHTVVQMDKKLDRHMEFCPTLQDFPNGAAALLSRGRSIPIKKAIGCFWVAGFQIIFD